VLASDHVLDVMYEIAVPWMKLAKFTWFSSSLTDEPPGSGIHSKPVRALEDLRSESANCQWLLCDPPIASRV
jgi:hypothetical protein